MSNTRSLIHIPFLPTTFSRRVGEERGNFVDYRIEGLRFAPQDPKYFVFQSLRGENVVFIFQCILITRSTIPIPLPTTIFFTYVGVVSNVSWLLDRRLLF